MDARQQLILEQGLRRFAAGLNLMLVKSTSQEPAAEDYGLYVLVNNTKGNRIGQRGGQAAISEFARGGGMTLRQVEKTLKLIVRRNAEDTKRLEEIYHRVHPILEKYGTVGDAVAAGALQVEDLKEMDVLLRGEVSEIGEIRRDLDRIDYEQGLMADSVLTRVLNGETGTDGDPFLDTLAHVDDEFRKSWGYVNADDLREMSKLPMYQQGVLDYALCAAAIPVVERYGTVGQAVAAGAFAKQSTKED